MATDLADLIATAAAEPDAKPWQFVIPDAMRDAGVWTEPAVRRLVCEYREADWPRLVYADWLDEHGGTAVCPVCSEWDEETYARNTAAGLHVDCSGRVPDGNAAWAELIRVQVDLTGRACVCGRSIRPCRTCVLRRQELEFFSAACGQFPTLSNSQVRLNSQKSAGCSIEIIVRRGFVDAVACSAADFLAHAADWFWSPWQTVWLSKEHPRVPRPFPGTCHPLREVSLTTLPSTETRYTGTDRRTRLEGRAWRDWSEMIDPFDDRRLYPIVHRLLAAEWPDLTFHLRLPEFDTNT